MRTVPSSRIGVGKDAKKFVLQSTGRGVRIEPVKHARKRLTELYSAGKISVTIFEKIKDLALPVETLFIFGTRAGNLAEIIATFEEESGEHSNKHPKGTVLK